MQSAGELAGLLGGPRAVGATPCFAERFFLDSGVQNDVSFIANAPLPQCLLTPKREEGWETSDGVLGFRV